MNYKKLIVDYCESIGIDKKTVGFTECRIFEELRDCFNHRKNEGLINEFEEQDTEKRINPYVYMDRGKTIISIAFPYLFENNFIGDISFSKYTLGKDYHLVVSSYLEKVCAFIETLGGTAVHLVDSNSLPERYIAHQSGIGFIGKNNMLITEQYGSYVFIGEIITDLHIEKDRPMESKCGDCNICKNACPTGSIKGESKPNQCLSYITQKKEIEDKWFKIMDGRMFGCDTCQKVCPFNKHIEFSNIELFRPLEFMKNIDIGEICNINKKVFREKYGNSSCGWRGKNVLQRNAIINSFTMKKNINIEEINSPYVKNYYNRLLSIFKL